MTADFSQTIYLDYAATTPVDESVAEAMAACLTRNGHFGNPASRSHRFGWQAEEQVEVAREMVAKLIGAEAREIIFTSGATEADNLAIKGVAEALQAKGRHIITSQIEHKAVLDTCRYLETEGFTVTYLQPDCHGLISPEQVAEQIRPDTILVSIMHVNNEIGTIQPIERIGAVCAKAGVLFHVDAAQSVGKLPLSLSSLPVDLFSISGHKFYGPKGIGALYVRRKRPRIAIRPQLHGGGHERGLRSGTLPVHQIVGLGAAAQLAQRRLKSEFERITLLKDRLYEGLSAIESTQLNGSLTQAVPHILNVSFAHVEGESLIMAVKELAVSSGSACTSASLEPSYVLKALGIEEEAAHSSIRFSLGAETSLADIEQTIGLISSAVEKLRGLSPLWEFYKSGVDLKTIAWTHH